MQLLESRIDKLMDGLEKLVTGSERKEIVDLYRVHGEYGVAIENLCSVIEEKKILIDEAQKSAILEILKIMDFSKSDLEYYSTVLRSKN